MVLPSARADAYPRGAALSRGIGHWDRIGAQLCHPVGSNAATRPRRTRQRGRRTTRRGAGAAPVDVTRIYLSPPDVGEADRAAVLRAMDSGWVAPAGPELAEFEAELSAATGREFAVALSSGTAALHLGLPSSPVWGTGTAVIVPSLTFVATANAVRYLGAEPIFIDSDPRDWQMDATLLAEELRRRARRGRLPAAVVSVDLLGGCPDYERIEAACAEFEVPLVEDAAEALGATYRGQPAGSFGRCAAFSFNGNKIITTSGGGMLVSDVAAFATGARFLATQARDPAPLPTLEVGHNYRMSNLLAALGRGQLRVLEDIIGGARRN